MKSIWLFKSHMLFTIILLIKNCGMLDLQLQSTLIISKSNGPSETLGDIRTSTYQIFRIEEIQIEQPNFTNKYVI